MPASSAPAAPARPAAPAPLRASGPFAAGGDAHLLTVDAPALSPPLLPQTNVDLARSLALADSDADVDPEDTGDQRTGAAAATTGSSSLLGAPLSIQSASASAPETEVDDPADLIEVPLNPVLDLELIDVVAGAAWVSDTECVAASTPLSVADQTLADATVLELSETESLVTIEPGDDGAIDVEAATHLVSIPGPNDPRAVASTVTVRTAGANIAQFGALPGGTLIDVDVTSAPTYTAQASGLPGGASITGVDPVVNVTIADNPVLELNGETAPFTEPLIGFTLEDLLGGAAIADILTDLGLDPLLPIGDLLDDVLGEALGALNPLVRLSVPVTKAVAADGTSAIVTASLLRVEILAPDATGALEPVADALAMLLDALGLDVGEPLVDINLGPVAASAFAPAGGITCGDDNNPIELSKVNSAPAIAGSTFDYTIPIGNVGDCTLTNVAVTDTLTGPAGSAVVLTEPPASSVGTPTAAGSGLEQTVITWNDVGPIPPDTQIALRIRVQVPTSATVGQRYNDVVNVSANCDGRTVTRTFTLNEPPVVTPGTGSCNLTGSNKSASHLEVYPGEQFSFFVNVFNDAGQACTNVTVTDTLSEKVTFVSCSDGCTTSGRTVTWNIPSLAAGSSITLRVTVQVNAGATGTVPNTAIIDTPATNPVTVTTPGPTITDRSVLAPNSPAGRGSPALARTGPSAMLSWPVALGLGLVAVAAHRIRRRAIVT